MLNKLFILATNLYDDSSYPWYIDRTKKVIDWFYSPEIFFGIAKYAICILIGIILAYLICTKEGERMGINKDDVLSQVIYIVPLSILGARLWYMFGDETHTIKNAFSNNSNFIYAIKDIFLEFICYDPIEKTIRFSGLAIHGGIAVAFVMTAVACRIKKWKYTVVGDMVAPGLLIGQICGRWGNFFNKEAHGMVVGGWSLSDTNSSILVPNLTVSEQWEVLTKKWMIPKFIAKYMLMPDSANSLGESYYYGVDANGNAIYAYLEGQNFFHPTFLYESVLNLIGLGLYFILRRNKKTRSGYFIAYYLIWYGIVRFIIEYFRCDSLYLGKITWLKMAQLTSILMVVVGILLIIYLRFIKRSEYYLDVIKNNDLSKKSETSEEVTEVKVK